MTPSMPQLRRGQGCLFLTIRSSTSPVLQLNTRVAPPHWIILLVSFVPPLGMEIGRYMFGGFQMPGGRAHTHDDKAYKLLGSNVVGEIKEEFQARIFRPLGNVKEKLENETWKIVSKKMLTSCHGVFQFKNPNYQIAGVLPYFDHCGKYYKLHSKHLSMQRNLACLFTPSDTLVPHYLSLLDAFTNNKDYATPFPDIANVNKEHLELYLKRLNVFSSFVHSVDFDSPANEFQISGPFVSIHGR
eukprot:TRINITY_DN6755_c0_g1_i6.p1 TRINITY_DN6755_c0_g1~~TRINITY_DN6755_c0_g1_i6.p1  ORF type:complete len:243 (+),score=42.90 TRINITY_DN6755_c0_g1_i6:143-871(+)